MHKGVFLAALVAATMACCAAAAVADDTVILCTAADDVALGTMWRYFETWQSDIVHMEDGSLTPIDIYADKVKVPGDGGAAKYTLKKADHIIGSPFPPAGWRQPDFDDSGWLRHQGPFPNFYRSLAQVCLRGKFQVADPARVKELKLSLTFQGGAVAYLNGKEVGRANLPAGPVTDQTLADEYPHEMFLDGIPLEYARRPPLASSDPRTRADTHNPAASKRIPLRARTLEATIPAAALKPGVNVLAVEIHRAPSDPIQHTTAEMWLGHYYQPSRLWNRAQVETLELKAAADAGAVVPNIARPEGVQVWVEDVFTPLRPPATGAFRYADPNEPPAAMTLRCVRNGVVSGQLVAGARAALNGLKAAVTPLTGEGGTIPASALEIAYLEGRCGALESAPPAGKLDMEPFPRGVQPSKAALAALGFMQPVWLTVHVPRDARPGTYSGTLTITADGIKPIATPVQLKVIGDWVAPNPADFKTWIVAHESPDSVAMQYNVPLWSEEHWKHLDKVYALLAEIGVKDIHLPLIAKTHLANEQSMVRWIKQPDGSYDHDFSIFERYLDLAVKHLGKVPIACVYVHDYGFRIEQSHGDTTPIRAKATAYDPATKAVSEFEPPAWGTPEARAFWKPVLEKARKLLAQRGLEKSMLFGIAANNWVKAECCADLKALMPDIQWVNRTHYFAAKVGTGAGQQDVGFTANVGAAIGVYWDPQAGPGNYAWRTGTRVVHFPRQGNVYGAVFQECLATYRLFAEGVQLTHGQKGKSHGTVNGVGHIGADFWPVLKDPKGGPARSMGDRYVFWHSLSLAEVIPWILAPGADGAAACPRLRMLRESMQEAEARMFVQDALLDSADRLGPELAKRCAQICNDRTEAYRYISAFCAVDSHEDYFRVCSKRAWEENSEQLYQAAGEVAKALNK